MLHPALGLPAQDLDLLGLTCDPSLGVFKIRLDEIWSNLIPSNSNHSMTHKILPSPGSSNPGCGSAWVAHSQAGSGQGNPSSGALGMGVNLVNLMKFGEIGINHERSGQLLPCFMLNMYFHSGKIHCLDFLHWIQQLKGKTQRCLIHQQNSAFADVLNSLHRAQRCNIVFLKIQGAILTRAKQTRLSAEKGKAKRHWLLQLLQPPLSLPNLKSREAQESWFFPL